MRGTNGVDARGLRLHCTHENIVVIHDMNEHDGMPYLVLEYLEGKSLTRLHGERALPLLRIVEVMVSVVRALDHAHRAGVVHRDLKPDNIFVTKTGVVKVLDFGIAKLAGAPSIEGPQARPRTPAHEDETHITLSSDGPIGTRTYMSPEQWIGTDVDHRTDIWAAGVILFRLVAGVHPFEQSDARSLMYAVVSPTEPVRSVTSVVPTLPAALAAISDRCLRKPKVERFATARAARRARAAPAAPPRRVGRGSLPVSRPAGVPGIRRRAVLRPGGPGRARARPAHHPAAALDRRALRRRQVVVRARGRRTGAQAGGAVGRDHDATRAVAPARARRADQPADDASWSRSGRRRSSGRRAAARRGSCGAATTPMRPAGPPRGSATRSARASGGSSTR